MTYKRSWLGASVALLVMTGFVQAQEKKAPPPPPPLPRGVKALKDLAYVKSGHERQKLDLYLPEKGAEPLPVIVWIHGGGWQGGSKDRCPAVPFVLKGYAVASINYRLSQHEKFPAQIEDCRAAIRWLRAHAKEYNMDAEHFGVWGPSAGGHLVALLGTASGGKDWDTQGNHQGQSCKVQAVCDWFGPTEMYQLAGKNPNPENAVAKLLGGPVSQNKEKADKASPLTYVSRDAPPFLIMHGDKDKTVPVSQSEIFAAALKKAGVDVTLQILPGAAHGGPDFQKPEIRNTILDFFDKHLKNIEKK
jgi:acetyl esterase/lipase